MATDKKIQTSSAALLAEIEKHRAALAKDPASRIFAALADAYRRAGEYKKAVRVAQDGLRKHPNYISGMVALGRALLEDGNLDQAREQFEKVVNLSQDNLLARKSLGDIYLKNGQTSKALQAFKEILDINPGDKEIAAHLQNLEAQTKPPQDSLQKGHGELGNIAQDEESDQTRDQMPAYDAESDDPDKLINLKPVQAVAQKMEEETKELSVKDVDDLIKKIADKGKKQMENLEMFFQGVDVDRSEDRDSAEGYEVKSLHDVFTDERQKIGDRNPITTETMAELYIKQGYLDRALKVYLDILESDPAREDVRVKCEVLAEEIGMQIQLPSPDAPPKKIKAPEPGSDPNLQIMGKEDEFFVEPVNHPETQAETDPEKQPHPEIQPQKPVENIAVRDVQIDQTLDDELQDSDLSAEQKKAARLKNILNKIKNRSKP